MNGSNVTETLLHTGHTKVDLYWPYKMERTCKFHSHRRVRKITFFIVSIVYFLSSLFSLHK